ncbi:hypothetical protein P691DRAFT_719754 [Macrolepiota fuliginosa MF-IS2]|uniref:Uncharacterized protein n=1 Tax=Macrolepiota fuliginosa MF-IS2 TaxID=1400762 RepID=A0A9P5XQB0_9AGAR|nr:hypothetical protein P691DRAFT_719754 [Macrolepiota fuliginosa MF-IS2]
MSRCPSLGRLAKPPVYTHVHFYCQHPGSPTDLYQRKIGPNVLDPSHPATKTSYKNFPSASTDYFRLRAFPNALLIPNPDSTGSPAWPRIDSWVDRTNRAAEFQKRLNIKQTTGVQHGQSDTSTGFSKWVAPPVLIPHPDASVPMSLYFSIGKARTHKHAVKRRRLRTKLKDAINLVVTRGAQAREAQSGTRELVFDEDEVRERGNQWILPDWAYMCYPDPSLYLSPHPDLIQQVRISLRKIWDSGMRLEDSWAEAEMRKQTGSLPTSSMFEAQVRAKPQHAKGTAFSSVRSGEKTRFPKAGA